MDRLFLPAAHIFAAALRPAFISSSTLTEASRVYLEKIVGSTIGETFGLPGKILGTGVGYVQDKFGNQIVKKGLDFKLDYVDKITQALQACLINFAGH